MKIEVIDKTDLAAKIKQDFEQINLKPLYEGIGLAWISAVNRNFQRAGAYFNSQWAELTPETIKRKGKSTILEDSGDFQRTFTFQATNTDVTVIAGIPGGAETIAGAALHFGSKKNNLPARPVFPLAVIPPDLLEEMEFLTGEYFSKVL